MNNLIWTILLCVITICSLSIDILHKREINRLVNELAIVKVESNHASRIVVPDTLNGDGVTEYKVIALNNIDLGDGVTAHNPLYIDQENYKLLLNVIRVQIARKND